MNFQVFSRNIELFSLKFPLQKAACKTEWHWYRLKMGIFSSPVVEVQLSIANITCICLSWNCIFCINEANEQSVGNTWAQLDSWYDTQIFPPLVKSLLMFHSSIFMRVGCCKHTQMYGCLHTHTVFVFICSWGAVGHKQNIVAVELFPVICLPDVIPPLFFQSDVCRFTDEIKVFF